MTKRALVWNPPDHIPNDYEKASFSNAPREIVLLHGFIKKTRKTPTEDRALALQRKNAYLKTS
jgi:hypothetical protein